MDIEDDPIEISEINMPESAKDYYIEQGYDESDFYNEEERYENYCEWRHEHSFDICRGLELQIAFDDDYNMTEPDENTDYYVFDYDDDRDPLSWTEISVYPSVDDNIIHVSRNDNVAILNTKYDNTKYLYCVKGANTGRYRDWGAIKGTNKYIFCNNYDDVFFAVVSNPSDYNYHNFNTLGFFRGDFEAHYVKLPKNVDEDIIELSLNNQFNNYSDSAYGFLEINYGNGFHGLFYGTDNGLEVLIKKDIPLNEEKFEIDENGIVHCQYREYNLNKIFGGEDNSENTNYHFSEELNNGDYLVEKEVIDDNSYKTAYKTVYNILNSQTKELLFNFWADEINEYTEFYNITFNDKSAMYNFNGQPITDFYKKVCPLLNDSDVICGIDNDKTSLIDKHNGQTFLEVLHVKTDYPPKNNRIVIVDFDKKYHVYDFVKREYVYKESTNDYPLFIGQTLIWSTINDKFYILDYGIDNYPTIEFSRIIKLPGFDGYKLINEEGKYNALNKYGNLITPVWCDSIEKTFQPSGVLYKSNGKYFIYNYDSNQFFVNPNGIECFTEILYFSYGGYSCHFVGNNISVYYLLTTNKFARYKIGNQLSDIGDYPSDEIKNQVESFINYICGKTSNSVYSSSPSNTETVNSMTEQFKRMLNRLNEARKFNI